MKLSINDSTIVWPGNMKTKPEGFLIPTHLNVLTIEEKPFVYVRKSSALACNDDEVPCPHYNILFGDEREYFFFGSRILLNF